MSTFGKKALSWWDHNNTSKEAMLRFNHTPMDVQLQILKKWYPIGTRCVEYVSPLTNKLMQLGPNWKIIAYSEYTVGRFFRVTIGNEGLKVDKHPLALKLDDAFIKEQLRDYKIDKILKWIIKINTNEL